VRLREDRWEHLVSSRLTFEPVDDLEKWAYKIEIEDDSSNCEMHDAHGLGPALASLGLNQEAAPDGLINCYTIWHQDSNRKDANGNKIAPRDQTYTVEGRTYRVRVNLYIVFERTTPVSRI
jgi:hypothetical protein